MGNGNNLRSLQRRPKFHGLGNVLVKQLIWKMNEWINKYVKKELDNVQD